jgi:hypothetical protein
MILAPPLEPKEFGRPVTVSAPGWAARSSLLYRRGLGTDNALQFPQLSHILEGLPSKHSASRRRCKSTSTLFLYTPPVTNARTRCLQNPYGQRIGEKLKLQTLTIIERDDMWRRIQYIGRGSSGAQVRITHRSKRCHPFHPR